MKYVLVSSKYAECLTELVQTYLDEGFQLKGETFTTTVPLYKCVEYYYNQVVIKDEDSEQHIVPMKMITGEDNNDKKEFILEQISDRIFLIATKEQFDESGSAWLKFPMTIHGFLKVEGQSFKKSFVSTMHISDDVLPSDIEALSIKARESVLY